MKIEKFIRRPFDVNAVQVTPSNAVEVAEWCGGKVGTTTYKLAGFDTQLNIVLVPGNGPNKGKFVEARLGYWVVEHLGKFRVYRNHQLHEMFEEKFVPVNDALNRLIGDLNEQDKPLQVGEKVESTDPETDGAQGKVVYTNQVLVEFGPQGMILFDQSQLKRIEEFSEQTKQIREAADRDLGLEKINALRAAATNALNEKPDVVLGHADKDGVRHIDAVVEVSGMRAGSTVLVTQEGNEFKGEKGVVMSFDEKAGGVQLMVKMFDDLHSSVVDAAIPFLPSELQLVEPELKQDDMVEILVQQTCTDGEPTGPVGTTGRVTVTGVEYVHHDVNMYGIEVLFADGRYSHFLPHELKKI